MIDSPSRVQRVAGLDIGESETLSTFISLENASTSLLLETRKGMSANMRVSVQRAAEQTGKTYETTAGEHLTDIVGGGFIVTATAVCVATP